MDFSDALICLTENKKIKRPGMDGFIKIEEGEFRVYRSAISLYKFDASILLSDDWVVIEDEEIPLTFGEAIKELKKGNRVKLFEWKDQYIEINKITKEIVLKHFVYTTYYPNYQDLLVDDWEVIAELIEKES